MIVRTVDFLNTCMDCKKKALTNLMFRTFNFGNISQADNCVDTLELLQ